jgi:guanylate kinase
MKKPNKRGLMLVVSAPSGGGKTTLCHRLRAEFPRLAYSISFTTRPMREGEQDGVHYHFVDEATFKRRLARGEMAEHAVVHGNYYGTAKASIEASLEADQDVLFDVDWQGAVQLQKVYPDDAEMVFILPPSLEVLSRRLKGRGTDLEVVIRRRLAAAQEEIRHYQEYGHLVVNDKLDQAYDDLRCIYRAARLTRARQASVAERLVAGA